MKQNIRFIRNSITNKQSKLKVEGRPMGNKATIPLEALMAQIHLRTLDSGIMS